MTPNNPSLPVTHDTALQRFEVHADGALAFLSYTREGTAVVMDHTYVPDAFRGRGVGAALVRAALDEARRQNGSVVLASELDEKWHGALGPVVGIENAGAAGDDDGLLLFRSI